MDACCRDVCALSPSCPSLRTERREGTHFCFLLFVILRKRIFVVAQPIFCNQFFFATFFQFFYGFHAQHLRLMFTVQMNHVLNAVLARAVNWAASVHPWTVQLLRWSQRTAMGVNQGTEVFVSFEFFFCPDHLAADIHPSIGHDAREYMRDIKEERERQQDEAKSRKKSKAQPADAGDPAPESQVH